MKAAVVRGRILVSFDGDDIRAEQQRTLIKSCIGSASIKPGAGTVSCALSVDNFRKLRIMGCKLEQDEATTSAVSKLQMEARKYDEESAAANEAKEEGGSNPIPGYSFKLKPFPHQEVGFRFLHSIDTPALFGDCGVGKTAMLLTFAESLIQQTGNYVFIIVCPVNLINSVWIEETSKFTNLKALSLRDTPSIRTLAADWPKGSSRSDPEAKRSAKKTASRRHKKELDEHFEQDADVYVVNTENIISEAKLERILKLCKRHIGSGRKLCLVIDESSKIKSHASKSYKAAKKIRALCTKCVIMTGTPAPNGALDLWAQFSILDDGMTLQPSFKDYQFDICYEQALGKLKTPWGNPITKWIQKPGVGENIYRKISPRTIRFKAEDVISLPGQTFNIRHVEMNREQQEAYEAMEEMLYAEVGGSSVTAKISAAKLMKLREITGGFVMDDDKKAHPLGKVSPKALELDSLLEQSIAPKLWSDGPPSKALVWANYQWECSMLVQRYSKYGALGLFGGISKTRKDDAIKKFRTDDSCKLLVCHPAAAAHGLTLVEGNYAFYYSLSYNFEEFYQSYKRLVRPGQKRVTAFYFLVCPSTIDEIIMKALREKKNLSDIITDGGLADNELIKTGPLTWNL